MESNEPTSEFQPTNTLPFIVNLDTAKYFFDAIKSEGLEKPMYEADAFPIEYMINVVKQEQGIDKKLEYIKMCLKWVKDVLDSYRVKSMLPFHTTSDVTPVNCTV